MVPAAQGEEWVNLLNSGHSVVVNMVDPASANQTVYHPKNTATGGLLAPPSSWGLSWELDVKPQFGAPGQNILSTWIPSQGGLYRVTSGTSMSTPLVTSAYALLMQARGTRDAATLRNLLSATAKPNIWYDGTRTYDILAPVPQQGAGLIQAYDAAVATTLLNVSSLALNDTDHFVRQISFTITNLGSQEVTYQLRHVKAATVYASSGSFIPDPEQFELKNFPPDTASSWATLSFSASSVVVSAGGSATVTVMPTPPAGLDPGRLPIYSGYVAINGSNDEALSLPYVGVAGSMLSAPSLYTANTPTATFLGLWGIFIDPVPENTTFTIPRPTGPPNGLLPSRELPLPVAMFGRKLGTAYMRLDLIPLEVNGELNTTVVLGVKIAGSAERYPETFLAPGLSEDPFTGMLADGRVVPEGRYQFMLRALKVFGDREKPEDYAVQTLPPFNLRYQS